MPVLAVGERIFVRLSRAHRGYAKVREVEGHRFIYDVEELLSERGSWAAGMLLVIGEGQTWCRADPESIAALEVAEGLK